MRAHGKKTFSFTVRREWSEAKEINCEQTEILTALIMVENRDSARASSLFGFGIRGAIVRESRSEFKAVIDFCSSLFLFLLFFIFISPTRVNAEVV
jgi:hypothetical protein